MVSIQSGSSIAKGLFQEISFEALTVLRVGFSALILSLVFKPWKVKISFHQLCTVAFYGFSLGAMNFFFYKSLQTTPLGIAVAIEFLGPLGVAVYYSKSIRDFLWVLCAGVGVYLVLPIQGSMAEMDLKSFAGPIYAALAGLFWALYIVFGKRVSKIQASSFQLTAGGMIFSFVIVTLLAVISGNGIAALDVSYWPIGFFIAILSSAVPYGLEMKALENLSSKTFGVLMSLEPAIATLIGFLFIAEKLTTQELMGVLFVIVASAGTTLAANPSNKKTI
jgi:inner membrane transporter RhtA